MIVFVTGVPGAGKALLAMKLVKMAKFKSIYLSGNGPLLNVLSYGIDKAYKKKHRTSIKKEAAITLKILVISYLKKTQNMTLLLLMKAREYGILK